MAESAAHTQLATGRWQTLTLAEQLGNIGSEVGRAIRAKQRGDEARLAGALDRALELFDLTTADPALRHRLREICRAREVICDYLVGDNRYSSTPESLEAYFDVYASAARHST